MRTHFFGHRRLDSYSFFHFFFCLFFGGLCFVFLFLVLEYISEEQKDFRNMVFWFGWLVLSFLGTLFLARAGSLTLRYSLTFLDEYKVRISNPIVSNEFEIDADMEMTIFEDGLALIRNYYLVNGRAVPIKRRIFKLHLTLFNDNDILSSAIVANFRKMGVKFSVENSRNFNIPAD